MPDCCSISKIKMNKKIIPVYAINLKSRTDRKKFILTQFFEREEFQFYLVEAHDHKIGAIGLWITIRNILKDLVDPNEEYIILCQDDHLFTMGYSKEHLLYCIDEVRSLRADLLTCGVSGFTTAIQISQNIFWVEKFSGLQFAVIFRKFFQKILDANFETVIAADLKLCELTENKFFIYPFLSRQKEFGYSDVTAGNNAKGHIDNAFKNSSENVTIINRVSNFYKQKLIMTVPLQNSESPESIVIPTYIIHLNEKRRCLSDIEKQFTGKEEFDIRSLKACHHKNKQLGLWLSIKKIIEIAIENDDDVIIICREDHQFTEHYERSHFINLIWQAGILGCNVLIGGMGSFNLALPISDVLFWIDSFWSSKFFIIYRDFYIRILQEPFSDSDTLEMKFSEMTSNKMGIFPYISNQNDFGYSGDTDMNNVKGQITNLFDEGSRRLDAIQKAYLKYQLHGKTR